MKPKRSTKFPETRKTRTGRKIGGLRAGLAIVILGGLAAIGGLYYGQQSASAEPAIPHGVSLTSWFDNGQGGQHLLQIFQGAPPPAGVQIAGTVMTDTDCTPDAEGLSHCHNRIDLANGQSFTVVNTHIMTVHPCLSPGEAVVVRRLNAGWVIASERS